VRLKILELLAMGKPVVSTTLGAEGSEVEDGRHLILADTAEAFALSVVAVLRDDLLRERLSAEARQFAVAHYDFRMLAELFEKEYRRAIDTHDRVLNVG